MPGFLHVARVLIIPARIVLGVIVIALVIF